MWLVTGRMFTFMTATNGEFQSIWLEFEISDSTSIVIQEIFIALEILHREGSFNNYIKTNLEGSGFKKLPIQISTVKLCVFPFFTVIVLPYMRLYRALWLE